MFYFAWVDKEDSTFSETEHVVEDEQVFGFSIEHSEGDFPSLTIEIINPRIGLLVPSRKQWAWLSYEDEAGDVIPLFFGRLVGIPQQLQDEIVRLTFVARPDGYADTLSALADTLKQYPYWDEIWFSEEERVDPDSVLEARSALWHIDRVTHAVTISDILTHEDGLINFGGSYFYDSLDVSLGESPARKVIVNASVKWVQGGSGSIDLTKEVLDGFRAITPTDLFSIDGEKKPNGPINVLAGEALVNSWPSKGQNVGGGWSVGNSYAEAVGNPPTPPIMVEGIEALNAIHNWRAFPRSKQTLQDLFVRSPGFLVEVRDTRDPNWVNTDVSLGGSIQFMWLPIWRLNANIGFDWKVERNRSETVDFEVTANVQPILTDPGDEEIVYLNVGTADVDEVIGDRRRNRYFSTDRGRHSFEHLIARARAVLLARSRAVTIDFSVPFDDGLQLSCRKSAFILDGRLPGGQAAGKVKSYSLNADGDTGVLVANVTIACTVGRGGEVSVIDGDPVYVESGYVEEGYQIFENSIVVPIAGEIGYSGMDDYPIDDDGINLQNINKIDHVESVSVTGSLEEQQEAASSGGTASSSVAVVDRINAHVTTVSVSLTPLTGGPFETVINPTLTDLMVPMTIDLEEEPTEV